MQARHWHLAAKLMSPAVQERPSPQFDAQKAELQPLHVVVFNAEYGEPKVFYCSWEQMKCSRHMSLRHCYQLTDFVRCCQAYQTMPEATSAVCKNVEFSECIIQENISLDVFRIVLL